VIQFGNYEFNCNVPLKMSDKRYKEQDPIPYDLPTPYLPKELDIVSSGDKRADLPFVRQNIPVPKALRDAFIEGAKEDDASKETKQLLNSDLVDPNVLKDMNALKLAESKSRPFPIMAIGSDTPVDYDCPNCMHESGEGRIKQDCNVCNDTGAVDFNKWKELHRFEPPDISIDSPPNELIKYVKDAIADGLQGIIFENTEESKKRAIHLLRDMLVEMRNSWLFEKPKQKSKRKKRKR